jgi:hypothetical protein
VRGLKNIPPTATRDRRCLYYFALRERPLNGEPIIIAGNGEGGKGAIIHVLVQFEF